MSRTIYREKRAPFGQAAFEIDPDPKVPEVVLVRGDEVTRVKVPRASAWKVPNPDDLEPFFERHELLATESGDPWLKICMWGYRGDEDPCVVWSHVPLRPLGPARVTPPADVRRPAAWKAAAPKDTQIRIDSIGEYDKRMVCVDARGKETAPAEQDQALEIEVSWLGGSPPFYVARIVFPGLSDGHVEHQLYQACRPAVLSKNIVHGPRPWWAHEDEDGNWFFRHGGTQVGRVDRPEQEWSDPVFAPPR